MSTERIDAEIARLRQKVTDYQQRLKELGRKKVEVENTEIIAMVRNLSVTPGELPALLEQLRMGDVPSYDTIPTESEETDDETDE